MQEVTLSITDRIEEIEDRIDELRGDQDALEAEGGELPDEASDHQDDDEVDPAARRRELRQEYTSIEEDIRALETTRDTLEAKHDEWGGDEFVIKSFNFGDQANANDLFLQDMRREGKQAPEEAFNARKIRVVQVGVKQTPPDAPDHPTQYPPAVGEWLYEAIEDLNTYGDVEGGLTDFSIPSTLAED